MTSADEAPEMTRTDGGQTTIYASADPVPQEIEGGAWYEARYSTTLHTPEWARVGGDVA